MGTLVLNLPDRLRSRLETEAQRLGRTPEQMTKDALSAHLKPTRRLKRGSLFERTCDLCGRLKGGPTDLASSPAHLDGYGSWRR